MTELRTDEALLKALHAAASRVLTRAQLEKQRLFFVMGALPADNVLTREQVQNVLERHEGRKISVP